MATYNIVAKENLNIIPGFFAPVHVRWPQYNGDLTNLMEFTMYDGEELWDIPSTIRQVVISGTKADGTGFSYYCTRSGSIVRAPLMKQMTITRGPVPCNIGFFDASNNQINSARFILDIEPAGLQKETLESSNDFQTFVDYVDSAKYYYELSKSYAVGHTGIRTGENIDNSEYYAHLARMYKGSPLIAATAAEMTDKTRVYVYVGNETGYTNGNWYYWNDSAWVSGGVYNAQGVQTDTELITPDVAADAEAVGNRLQEKTQIYNTVADMRADVRRLSVGMTAQTLGYYAINDGGGTLYQIVNTVPTTHYEELSDSLYAKNMFREPLVAPETYGAVGDGVTDDSAIINAILADKKILYLSYGKSYLCKSDIKTPTNGVFHICGHGELLLDDASLVLQNYTTTQTRDLNISTLEGITIREIDQNSEKPCVDIVNGSRINIHDIMIYDGFYGLYIRPGTLGINVRDIRIDNSFIDTKERVGLTVGSGDSSYMNIIIREYKIGVDVVQNTNFFYKVHAWIENFETIYPNSIGYRLQSYNGSFNEFYGAYIDSFETPIVKTRASFEKFYSPRIINHPSNTVQHPLFVTSQPQALISFDTIFFTKDSDDYYEIPKNCYFDQIVGHNQQRWQNFSQITLTNGLSGDLYGRLTNAGLILCGRFMPQEDIPANTQIILFNGETSGYSFNLMNFYMRCEASDGTYCFIRSNNHSSITSASILKQGINYYLNSVIIPVRNRI